MSRLSRFACPSSSTSLGVLLSRPRSVLWWGLALGLAAHAGFAQLPASRAHHSLIRPLTTQFVKRKPRLTKPLELRKIPVPKRREVRRVMVNVSARVLGGRAGRGLESSKVVRDLVTTHARVSRPAMLPRLDAQPRIVAGLIENAMQAGSVVDMSLEMMDISALDTGEYQAMVIQDPQDRRNVLGFYHFAFAYSVTMRNLNADDWRPVRAIRRLADAVNRHTRIRCDLSDSYTYDSRKLFLTPLVPAVTRWAFKLTASEAANLGGYLLSGGFLFIDPTYRDWVMDRPAMASSYGMAEDALAAQGLKRGVDYAFERLPNRHHVYHCFFDFDGPPPAADAIIYDKVDGTGKRVIYDYLEGVALGGRLLCILSKKWYFNAWGDWGTSYPHVIYERFDPERPLQFGVNLVVFVLTQEGSITNRLMDGVAR